MKKKVIIDCDPGIDDFLALLLALNSEELEVLGITIVGGNVDLNTCGENALKALELTNSLHIPVYLGNDKPLCKKLEKAENVHGADGLGNTNLPKVKNGVLNYGAEDFIIETLHNNEEVSIIALAPLTNIAKAIMKDKSAFENLNEFVSMGGTFKECGNCTPVSEFNYYVDPHAADYVLKNIGKKVHIIGLDVTNKTVLTPNMVEFIRMIDGKLSKVVSEITKFYGEFYWKFDKILGSVINDPLAVGYFIDKNICKGFSSYTEICKDGIAEGMCIVDKNNLWQKEHNSIILTEVDAQKFLKKFIRLLLKDKKEEVEKYIELLF
ncbi:nucleoside hydrolase [Clostridium senegalense]|uniref:nucleoside hydrolase n=1 Tax=Clostridium senegalense TaxID=1465809 RepID=UPI001C10508B|nr:nucleoside hydrolase [Clostridium senegalense]MBU5227366.1 nucleoside hydrolase [Clostridium senegalense]